MDVVVLHSRKPKIGKRKKVIMCKTVGAYDSEEAAARTYDLAALKYWGPDTILNFPVCRLTN